MANIITVVMTDNKLNAYNLSRMEKFDVVCDYDVKPGDMISSPDYNTMLEVYFVKGEYTYDGGWNNYPYLTVSKINGKTPTVAATSNKSFFNNNYNSKNRSTNMNNLKTNAMFSDLANKYKSQFIPEKETNVRMSLTGLLCAPVKGEYVGIDAENKLTSFPIEMTIELPVYSILKMNSAIQVGEIVKDNGGNYAKVIKKNSDGTLKLLSFNGVTRNQKDIKDFVMGSSTTRVLINLFNFSNGENDFNPMMFMFMNGESFDVNSLLMLSMTPQGKNLFSNVGGGFNPMMLLMLDSSRKGGASNFMETMLMANMMGGMMNQGNQTNPLMNMFNMGSQPAMKPLNEDANNIISINAAEADNDDEDADLDDSIQKLMSNPDAVKKLQALLNAKA